MFNFNSIVRLRAWGIAKTISLVLIGALISIPLANVQANPESIPAVGAVNSPAAVTACTPTTVAVFKNRIHVRCASAVDGIVYFAASTSDAGNSARILSTITTAFVAGKSLYVYYDPADLSGSAIGCLNSDCRLIQGVEMFT